MYVSALGSTRWTFFDAKFTTTVNVAMFYRPRLAYKSELFTLAEIDAFDGVVNDLVKLQQSGGLRAVCAEFLNVNMHGTPSYVACTNFFARPFSDVPSFAL